ncbi:MAG: hypothetical protein KJ051_02930, partial [Thermoleophilia bacterium]|nr:hypothetical protein [Thermoleophilia bacterium]
PTERTQSADVHQSGGTPGFIVMWAWAIKDEKRDGYSITEYQRYWHENERQADRLQADRFPWPVAGVRHSGRVGASGGAASAEQEGRGDDAHDDSVVAEWAG